MAGVTRKYEKQDLHVSENASRGEASKEILDG